MINTRRQRCHMVLPFALFWRTAMLGVGEGVQSNIFIFLGAWSDGLRWLIHFCFPPVFNFLAPIPAKKKLSRSDQPRRPATLPNSKHRSRTSHLAVGRSRKNIRPLRLKIFEPGNDHLHHRFDTELTGLLVHASLPRCATVDRRSHCNSFTDYH
jgi:hypothetical protein